MTFLSRLATVTLGLPILTAGQAPLTIDLVSRSSDKKSFGTFHGSLTPSIGGLDETGVKEGQFVAYMTSWEVDPKHGGQKRQIMWFNRGNGKVAVVSHDADGKGGNGDSFSPQIDSSGYHVVFESWASNLTPGDTNKTVDVFVWNLMNDTVKMVSEGSNGQSKEATISRDGRFIAFTSTASNLTSGVDSTNTANVYLKDMSTGQVTLISKDPQTGKAVGGSNPSISEDGSRIAFYSYSSKLDSADKNELWDIFVWSREGDQIKRVSLTSTGQERDQGSESISRIVKPAISGDGRYVVYATTANNVIPGDTNKAQDVFVTDIDSGRTIRASEGANGLQGNGDSPVGQGEKIAISYDGKWVAFTTNAKNLGGNLIFRNWETGETMKFGQVGRYGAGTPTISRNAKWFAFPHGEELDKRFKTSGIFAVKNTLLKP